MSGFDNSVLFITKNAPGQMARFEYNTAGTLDFSLYNNDGTPEGVVAAQVGSICIDTTNADFYFKVTGSGNTGWSSVPINTGSFTDERVLRADGTSGIQDSGVTLDDSDVLSGATQINVDNLRLDANTLSSTNTDGNINLTTNGTGVVQTSKILTGNTVSWSLSNDDSTAAADSGANFQVRSRPEGVGDASITVTIAATRSYCYGIDNSDSDSLKINTLSASGVTPSTGTNYWKMTSSGERTLPTQPSFLAYLGTTDANVTGDGTVFILGDTNVGTSLTEVYDRNGDFLPGGISGAIFTAPVTGCYLFNFQVTLTGNDGSIALIDLITSNRTWRFQMMDPTAIQDSGANASYQGSIPADMDAGDTAYIQISESGGTKITDIRGTTSGTERTFWSGWLQG